MGGGRRFLGVIVQGLGVRVRGEEQRHSAGFSWVDRLFLSCHAGSVVNIRQPWGGKAPGFMNLLLPRTAPERRGNILKDVKDFHLKAKTRIRP